MVRLRVLPNDLDINLHMTNGRYLMLMDLGRFDLIVRMGLLREIVRRRWRPIVGSLTIRFRRSLNPFQSYELRTRLVCWDEKWFFIEQQFERGSEIAATAVVKGLFRDSGGNVPPQEVVNLTGDSIASPPMPEAVAEWQASEAMMREEQQASRAGFT